MSTDEQPAPSAINSKVSVLADRPSIGPIDQLRSEVRNLSATVSALSARLDHLSVTVSAPSARLDMLSHRA